jgi:REP element-mobilizing transposase RayT
MEILYYNLFTHFVFIVQDRYPHITEQCRERIEKYITGVVNRHGCKMFAIYANPDHTHFLVSRSPSISERELATIVADATERFINANHFCNGRFHWQTTCAAFSISKQDIDKVCKYILNQYEHHKKQSFADEYDKIMQFYKEKLATYKKIEDK